MYLPRTTFALIALFTVACAPAVPLGATSPASGYASPIGATKFQPELVAGVSHFTISPDHKHMAYTTDPSPGKLHVATVGGADVLIADLKDSIGGLQWVLNGQAVLYQTLQSEKIPGQMVDYDIPAMRILSSRLMLSRPDGGAPEVLLETPTAVWFEASPAGNTLVYASIGVNGSTLPLMAMDLEKRTSKLLFAPTQGSVHLSLSGNALAWYDTDKGQLQILELATGNQTAVAAPDLSAFVWLDGDRLLLIHNNGNKNVGLQLQTVARDGTTLFNVSVAGGADAPFPMASKANGAGTVSPDGKWAIALGQGQHAGAPLISLETGNVVYTQSYGWGGWLDALTLVGIFNGGVYTQSLSQATNGAAPSSVPSAPAVVPTAAQPLPTASAPAAAGATGFGSEISVPDAFNDVSPPVINIGQTYVLPTGTAKLPLTWRLLERDNMRANLVNGTLVGVAPGGVTLELRSGDRLAYVHGAVRDPASIDRYSFAPYGHPSRAAFPRPVVARDALTWARVWRDWWNAGLQPNPAPQPGPTSPPMPYGLLSDIPLPPSQPAMAQAIPIAVGPTGPPDPPPAPAIDFPARAVLCVNVDSGGVVSTRPIVTHIANGVVNLALPDVYRPATIQASAAPIAPGQPRPAPEPQGPRGYAFDVPALPPGVSVRLAAFPEGHPNASVPQEPEVAQ